VSAENSFLLGVLGGRVLESFSFLEDPQFSWDHFRVRAGVLGVQGFLFHRLKFFRDEKKVSVLARVPAPVCQDLESVYFKSIVRNTLILADFFRILEYFRENRGPPVLPLKGVGLFLAEIYDHPGQRLLSDLDIVVRQEDLPLAKKLLLEMGYVPSLGTHLREEDYLRKNVHLQPLISPRGIPLEVHWCFEPPDPQNPRFYKDHSRMWQTAREIKIGERDLCGISKDTLGSCQKLPEKVLVLSPEHNLIHMMIHLGKCDIFSFDGLMKTHLDIQALLEKRGERMDEHFLYQEIGRRNLIKIWLWNLAVLEPLKTFSHPSKKVREKMEWLHQKIIQEGFQKGCISNRWVKACQKTGRKISFNLLHQKGGDFSSEDRLLISLQKESSWKRKGAMMWRIVFPMPVYLADRCGYPPGSKNLYAAYLLRPFGLGARGLRFFLRKIWPKRLLSELRSFRDLREFVFIFWTLFLLPFYLRFYSLDQMMTRLTRRKKLGNAGQDPMTQDKTVTLADWVLGLNVGPFRPTCFRRSLLLYTVFRRHGIPVIFHCGIRQKAQASNSPWERPWQGHSWLSLQGRPFWENTRLGGENFTQTYFFPH
jgi:hypothetical protein